MNRQLKMQQLRGSLLRRRDAIRAALRGDLSSLARFKSESGDSGDVAALALCGELSSHMVEAESRELVKIDEALVKLNRGEFGDCEDCDQPIPLPRLAIVPYAALCIDCQVNFEKSGLAD